MTLSVIVCTHNPRRDYLERTLAALRAQPLPREQWELLLIDNASKEPLAGKWDLSWHPGARHLREEELGLTPARLRGFKEARANLFVLVDDDNVLAPDYLAEVLRVAEEHPRVGVWNGEVNGEFEIEPPQWTRQFWSMLGIRDCPRQACTNLISEYEAEPFGAGMCVRRVVAEAYVKELSSNPQRRRLDRCGNSLVSSGDVDIAFTACALGMEMGRFPQLKLTHLIPAARLQQDYLFRLCEANHLSSMIVNHVHGLPTMPPLGRCGILLRKVKAWGIRDPISRRYYLARIRAQFQFSEWLGSQKQ